MLAVEIYTADVPEVLTRFGQVVAEEHWLRRADAIRSEIRGKPLLKGLLEEENEISLALARCSELTKQHGALPISETLNVSLYGAFALAAQVNSIVARLPQIPGRQLLRRLHGAFRNPEEMRALRLELTLAAHFVRRGHQVSFPETDGTGTFDLLIADLGSCGLEVESKAFSDDKGRRVHRREAIEFYSVLSPHVTKAVDGLTSGLAVIVTLSDRLPSLREAREAICEQVIRCALSSQNFLMADGTEITVRAFDPTPFGDPPTINRNALDAATGTINREAAAIGTSAGGVFVVALQAKKDDQLIEYILNTLKDAGRRQLTRTHPGFLLGGLRGVSGAALRDIASQDRDHSLPPNKLRLIATELLSSVKRDHVVGVGFLSGHTSQPRISGVINDDGVTYYFARRESKMWHDDFSGLFS